MEQENFWYGELVKHLEEKEWSEVQITNLAMKIGRSSLLNCEAALELLEYVQTVDEQIANQKEIDDLYATAPVFSREQIHKIEDLKQADAGWD